MINREFWKGKKVLITGHTGFKGSWLCLWLHALGAEVTGFSLSVPTVPSLFETCKIHECTQSVFGDIRDKNLIQSMVVSADPDILFHMAAQPLVTKSYHDPVETYETNVLGTVYLLEAVRIAIQNKKRLKAIVNVTSDKCYKNNEWPWGYRENDPLGGYDPYSNSKACAELITACYRNSYFNPRLYSLHGVGIATARAGNVIGGGDWASHRLVPDCVRAFLIGNEIIIRNPNAIRPWQHVLEPLSGYLLLAEKLYTEGSVYSDGWNFGPDDENMKTVEWVVQLMCKKWGQNSSYSIADGYNLHEARYLKLDCSKAKTELSWYPKWNLEQAIEKVIEWTRAFQFHQDVKTVCLKQIFEYEEGN